MGRTIVTSKRFGTNIFDKVKLTNVKVTHEANCRTFDQHRVIVSIEAQSYERHPLGNRRGGIKRKSPRKTLQSRFPQQ